MNTRKKTHRKQLLLVGQIEPYRGKVAKKNQQRTVTGNIRRRYRRRQRKKDTRVDRDGLYQDKAAKMILQTTVTEKIQGNTEEDIGIQY